MEEKSRTRFAILIALILVAAVVYSFTFNLFGDTPSVGLASGGGTTSSDPGEEVENTGAVIQVAITPETVQSVIEKTLSRYRSYSRDIQVEYLQGGKVTGTMSASVAVDNGWTRVDLTTQSGVEHTIVGDGLRYRYRCGGGR